MEPNQVEAPTAIRHCLSYLLADAKDAGLHLVALHIKLAIMELDDEIGTDDTGFDDGPAIEQPLPELMLAE